jgi:hypothetical protein
MPGYPYLCIGNEPDFLKINAPCRRIKAEYAVRK